jgi:hypothetical protein
MPMEVVKPEWREHFLTVRWNNILSLALGVPALVYVAIAVFTSVLSDRAAFAWLVLIGVVY